MTDFENVQRWEAESAENYPYMANYPYGDYVSYEDYQALLEAYKEIQKEFQDHVDSLAGWE